MQAHIVRLARVAALAANALLHAGAGGREGQIYLASWNHEAGAAALKDAPARRG